ncbi:MAG: DUF6580 family putative transport protein [Verrucomicrobiota bacterium]
MNTALLLFVAVVLYRLLAACYSADHSWLLNFSPVVALALCGPLTFPRQVALVLPLAILFASDVVLNAHFGAALVTGEMLARYVALVLIALLGLRLRKARSLGTFLLASTAGSSSFYLITNTVSWWTAPEYAKTMAGWGQALTIGIPGFPPTWVFFRNSLISDGCFTMVLLGCLMLAARTKGSAETTVIKAGATAEG